MHYLFLHAQAGLIWPLFSRIFAELVFLLLGASFDPDKEIHHWMAVMGALAFVAFIGHFLVQVCVHWLTLGSG